MFSTKSIGIFEILVIEIFYELLTNDVVSFEQPGPESVAGISNCVLLMDKYVAFEESSRGSSAISNTTRNCAFVECANRKE